MVGRSAVYATKYSSNVRLWSSGIIGRGRSISVCISVKSSIVLQYTVMHQFGEERLVVERDCGSAVDHEGKS